MMQLDRPSIAEPRDLADRYRLVRAQTEALCQSLAPEDFVIQSMPAASPVKWHLAHTSWFFETFVLVPNLPTYRPFHPNFNFLFNSYYETVGPRWPRPHRGLLSRPTVQEVFAYRRHVDEHMARLGQAGHEESASVVRLGLNHEQQHQELILTDLKHAWSFNPLHPALPGRRSTPSVCPVSPAWLSFPEGLVEIGHAGTGFAFDFAFDNEMPRHRVFVPAFALANRLVTNADYLTFMHEGGYDRPDLWLSDGWAARNTHDWSAPLYWRRADAGWQTYTLHGVVPLHPNEPVCHLSYYEADAFARWAGARLPTEAEWEVAAASVTMAGHFLESDRLHPAPCPAADDVGPLVQMFGDVWQWTQSPYVGYPGYRPSAGALGEYNGKFMCNQMVLRGASCATPRSHARVTYRNFFPPEARWQFSGLRLAKDLA